MTPLRTRLESALAFDETYARKMAGYGAHCVEAMRYEHERTRALIAAMLDVVSAAEAVSADHVGGEKRAQEGSRFRTVALDREKLIAMHDALAALEEKIK